MLGHNPNLLFYIEIEVLVDIVKKIYLEFSHVEVIHNKISDLFSNNTRIILLYLRSKSKNSGERLYRYIKKREILLIMSFVKFLEKKVMLSGCHLYVIYLQNVFSMQIIK